MDIDGALVMDNFLSAMGNLFETLLLFTGLLSCGLKFVSRDLIECYNIFLTGVDKRNYVTKNRNSEGYNRQTKTGGYSIRE